VVVAYWEVFRLAALKNKIQSLRIAGLFWKELLYCGSLLGRDDTAVKMSRPPVYRKVRKQTSVHKGVST
jgi:hypothetical protein